jgi:NTP pyrophosphatase (non-canonical NTP hydrolase)
MLINSLAREIREWADATFPNRTDQSMFLKLYGEIAELIEGKDPETEVADVLILVLDYAARKGINPSTAVQNKMNINRGRAWVRNDLGVWQHVK